MDIGDRVKIIKGLFVGCEGRIVDINMSMQFPYRVEVTKDGKGQEMFYNSAYIDPVENGNIKIGDKIIVTSEKRSQFGKIGIVKNIVSNEGMRDFIVMFRDNPHTYPFDLMEIEKIQGQKIDRKHKKKTPPQIVVYQNKNIIVAKDLETGKTAEAKCSKEDKFDFNFGAFLAVSRLLGFDDIIKIITNEAADGVLDMVEALSKTYELLGKDITKEILKTKAR